MITWKQNLKHLSVQEYEYLLHLCRLSKNVYNEALYNIRQHYFIEGSYLRYEANFYQMKDSDNYRRLGGSISQQTMRCVDAAFKSFFSMLDGVKKNKFSSRQVNIPRYLEKDGLYPLHLVNIRIDDEGRFLVPVSRLLRKEYDVRVKIKCPPKIRDKHIHQVHIIPKCNGKFFEVRYIFDEPDVEKPELCDSKVLAIDLGVDNFATCVTSDYDAFIVDGKCLKSINQWYNKELARLSSIKDHQGIKVNTKRQYLLTLKRDRRIQDYIYCSAKYIINYCIENKIGNIVIGYNDGFQEIRKVSKKVKQNFKFLPYGKLKSRIKFLCEMYGINYTVQEESYTSQASFFDNDSIPIWNPVNPVDKNFSGRRISRGIYRTSSGKLINADVNAALNIMKKSKLNDIKPDIKQCRGQVISPVRIICTP